MVVVKESEPFDWIQWMPGMWEVLPFCNPLSLLIFQPNVHIQQFCLAGNLNISVSERLLSWQQEIREWCGFLPFWVPFHTSHTGNYMRNEFIHFVHFSQYNVNEVMCKLGTNLSGVDFCQRNTFRCSSCLYRIGGA